MMELATNEDKDRFWRIARKFERVCALKGDLAESMRLHLVRAIWDGSQVNLINKLEAELDLALEQ